MKPLREWVKLAPKARELLRKWVNLAPGEREVERLRRRVVA